MSTVIPSVEDLLEKAVIKFKAEFRDYPDVASFGPGRVNLIGEHTDYNDGFVLPMALPMVTVMVGKLNGTKEIHLYTASHEVDEPHKVKFSIEDKLEKGFPKWANYVKGVIAQFSEISSGFDAVIVTSIPIGGGLSSSAALEMATYTFLEILTGKATANPIQKALSCQKAEHEYADVPCGIMDQLVSVMGKDNTALLIDCRTLKVIDVPLDDSETVVLITDSKVKHELSGSEYAVRRKQCEEVRSKLKKKSLRDVSESDLLKLEKDDKLLLARGRHVVTEIKRTEEGAKALMSKDYVKFGKLMTESHKSLRDDYEVSCKELDEIVDATLGLDGVYGSRMTGGGFGGCTVTLLRRDAVNQCIEKINEKYSGKAEFYICKAASGSKHIDLPNNRS